MPREGYKTVTINGKVYQKAEDFIKVCNDKTSGMKKYRSMTHFIEEAVTALLKKESVK